jgi:hypothetical protein
METALCVLKSFGELCFKSRTLDLDTVSAGSGSDLVTVHYDAGDLSSVSNRKPESTLEMFRPPIPLRVNGSVPLGGG